MSQPPAQFRRSRWQVAQRFFVSVARGLLDFVYPPYCVLCEERLAPDDALVCKRCWDGLPRLTRGLKPGAHFSREEEKIYFATSLAVWQYDNQVEQIIHLMKYDRKKSLAKRLGAAMGEVLLGNEPYARAACLVPVPLHKAKLRERGYNQSLLLCEEISAATRLPIVENTLQRIRYTKPQATLGAEERIKNVDQAFAVKQKERIAGRVCILVDDVVTTGCTVNACARELRGAGASEVLVLTAARAG